MTIEELIEKLRGLERWEKYTESGYSDDYGYAAMERDAAGEHVRWDDLVDLLDEFEKK